MRAMSKLLQVLLWSILLTLPASAQSPAEAPDSAVQAATTEATTVEASPPQVQATVPQFALPVTPGPTPEADPGTNPDPEVAGAPLQRRWIPTPRPAPA